MSKLNAENLKSVLWDTLQAVKNKQLQPEDAHAISSQAREILKTINLQVRIGQYDRAIPEEVNSFCGSKKI